MDKTKTYSLFIYGTFEDHDEVMYFCMEILSNSTAVKTLKYVIENNNNIVVIFDSDLEPKKLSAELLTFMINDTVRYYFLYPLNTLITAHLPEKIRDSIFKPSDSKIGISVEYVEPRNMNFDLDDVLEKIEKEGLESLTEDEKYFLDNFEN